MALDTTVGGENADSYGELADYAAYVLSIYNEVVNEDAAAEADMRRAARYLDSTYIWLGTATTATQALRWPRYVSQSVDGHPVPSDSIPRDIIEGQFEAAYQIRGGSSPDAAVEGGKIKREKVDIIETEYEDGSGRDRPVYPTVDGLVLPYATGRLGGGAGMIGIKRA